MSTSNNKLIQHINTSLEKLNTLLNVVCSSTQSNEVKPSTNGALNYALRYHEISLLDLIYMGEEKAKSLKWVGPKVWAEAVNLTRQSFA